MLHENDKITVHVIDWFRRREIKTRNYGEVFTVTKHPQTGKLCIDWNRWNGPICGGDLFVPLTSFAWTVVFENVKTGRFYHCGTFTKDVVELSPEYDELRRAIGLTC